VGKVPELSDEARRRLGELQALSDLAESGDKEARRKLMVAVRESSPEVIARASDFRRGAQRLLIQTISVGSPLKEEALKVRLSHMRAEVAGANPTPLEVLLTERVVASWLLVEILEAFVSLQLTRGVEKRVTPSYLFQLAKLLESVQRRHLAAIKALAQVRRLLKPAVQINVGENQVNVASDFKRYSNEQNY
jgi:hypothetical protein